MFCFEIIILSCDCIFSKYHNVQIWSFLCIQMLTSNFAICSSVLWYLFISVTELHFRLNRIGGVMVSVIASSVVDRGFTARSGQTKDYEIGMYCFSAKHATLRSKSKERLARNQNDVSEWSDMSTRGLLFQWASTIKIQLTVLI